jgi:hypothetical protein
MGVERLLVHVLCPLGWRLAKKKQEKGPHLYEKGHLVKVTAS